MHVVGEYAIFIHCDENAFAIQIPFAIDNKCVQKSYNLLLFQSHNQMITKSSTVLSIIKHSITLLISLYKIIAQMVN